MKVDPNGKIDIWVEAVRNGVNLAVLAIPYLGPLKRAIERGAKTTIKKLLNKSKVKDKLKEAIYNGLVTLKVKATKAKNISVSVVGAFFTGTGLSVGSIVVYVMKKNIKTINKTKKKYFLFGKKGKKEYFRF